MVPVPLPPADVKANSVLSCFFLPQVNSSKTRRFKPCQPKREMQAAVIQVIQHITTESDQLYISL